jgi:hypothetical protein
VRTVVGLGVKSSHRKRWARAGREGSKVAPPVRQVACTKHKTHIARRSRHSLIRADRNTEEAHKILSNKCFTGMFDSQITKLSIALRFLWPSSTISLTKALM